MFIAVAIIIVVRTLGLFGSKVIITGDASQKDLMPGTRSGLDVAVKVLQKIEGIAFCSLTSRDVVRHPLVQKIVKAYENYERKEAVAHSERHEPEGKARFAGRKRQGRSGR